MSENTPCPMHAAIFSSPQPRADTTFAAHLATCPACERDWNEWETLRTSARDLRPFAPTVEEAQQLRGSLLFATRPRKQVVSFARVAAIAAVLIGSGSVFAALGARYVFRKPAPTSDKTVTGTCPAQEPRLKSPPAQPAPTLAAPAIADSPVQEAMVETPRHLPRATHALPREHVLAPTPPAAPAPARSTRYAGPGDQAFEQAWQHLKQGDDLGAAEGFERASMLAAGQGVAADADYWHAIAQARHGSGPFTITALSSFLSRWPKDPRAPEVSAMLGWLHVEDGACDLAGPRFRHASRSARKDVRDSAEAGLGACSAK
jgi:TolA-binding protein